MRSVGTLTEALAEQLIAAWDWRKANPDVLQQPRAQWPRIGEEARAGRRQPFVGYAPGTHQYEPGQLMSHPRTMRKMAAAALFDHQRHQWPNFDADGQRSRPSAREHVPLVSYRFDSGFLNPAAGLLGRDYHSGGTPS
jgi:hypothetical protein